MPTLSADEGARVIAELDEKKEFDVSKDQISRIELKSPGLFGSGHILINAMPQQETRISLRHKVAFERLRDLMQVFYPEAVTLA